MGRSVALPVSAALGISVWCAVLIASPAQAASTGPTPMAPQGDISIANLASVAAVSPTDAWAVGQVQLDAWTSTLIEHWDGSSWQQVRSPSPGGIFGSSLTGVTALAADDVWAVGRYGTRTTGSRTLVLHWDGAGWSKVPSPDPSASGDNVLNAIAAVSADDVWAVGWHTSSAIGAVTLTEHWDGTAWSVALSPNPSHRIANELSGVGGLSDRDVWAVGSYGRSATKSSTLVAHWNGKRWLRLSAPNPGTLTNRLVAVSARAAKDVWAVGSYSNVPERAQSLIERWNGRRWLRVPAPDLGDVNSVLTAVSADSDQDAWAVGYVESAGVQQTLTLHWDGTAWAAVPSPDPGVFGSRLQAVAAGGPDNAWAVGVAFDSANVGDELITAWNGQEWRTY